MPPFCEKHSRFFEPGTDHHNRCPECEAEEKQHEENEARLSD